MIFPSPGKGIRQSLNFLKNSQNRPPIFKGPVGNKAINDPIHSIPSHQFDQITIPAKAKGKKEQR
jgi:hypothetical protein